jgi:class 3 adenylate cyclase
VNCTSCGHDNPEKAKFCLECGQAFALRCSSCATELPTGAKFCLECGTPASRATAGPETQRSPSDYTPKHLSDKILQSKSALEGERKQVTVLFADVAHSMELAEELDPEAWHQILERFFEILTEGVHRFEGTVNQYTGDGIMVLFGAPIAHEDHAQRAAYATLHLVEALRPFARETKREHGVTLSTRIGLNSGGGFGC